MKQLFYLILLVFSHIGAVENPWSADYQKLLMKKVGQQIEPMSTYPLSTFGSANTEAILEKYPDRKMLLFSYGSLINVASASRSMSQEALDSMKPVAAFGLKRLFNYKAATASRWGPDLQDNERAMLNVAPTTTYSQMINGVVFEVKANDLRQLIDRELGYDLVPIFIADWEDLMSENPSVQIKIAYTFYVPDELRQGVDYTQTAYYPVRGYLHAVQEGSAAYGEDFLNFLNQTTYLSDGTTSIKNWDQTTFSGILDTTMPK